jgi:signal transduction histidine kinase
MPQQLQRSAAWVEIVQALGLLALVGYLDYTAGYEIPTFLFYLFPIFFLFRRLGPKWAVLMCLLSTLVWLVNNTVAGEHYSGWLTPVWNTATRLAIFLLVVALFTVRHDLQVMQTEVLQNRADLNEAILERSRLERELLESTERERWRIGHDLHDGLCQHLTATALAGKVLAKKLAGQSNPDAEAADHLVGMVENAIELTRSLARGLHPVDMSAEGLVNALAELAANANKEFQVSCKLECNQTVSLATDDANMHLYRIAQEAISNAIRHGQAKKITLDLEDNGREIALAITDDGIGLSAEDWSKNGMGLQIMRYRAGMIGGELQYELLPTRGTRITCRLPESARFVAEAHARQS